MDKQPLVSICIPVYNGVKYLQDALNSILSQIYTNFEVVISDDHSEDDTLRIVEDFKKKVSFPVFIYNHEPAGIGANWNNCIKKSNGKFIKFLFQDDILYPTCIEELVKVAITEKGVGLVACKRSIIVEGKNNTVIKAWKKNYGNLQDGLELKSCGWYDLDSRFLKKEKFIKDNKIGEPSTVLFPRALVKKIGFFREDLTQVLDFEFYYRILKHKKIIILNRELAAFRIHPAQATNVNKNTISLDYEKYYRLLYENYFWYLGLNFQKKLLKRYHTIGKIYCYLRY